MESEQKQAPEAAIPEKKKKTHIWVAGILALPAVLFIVIMILLSLLLGPPITYPLPPLPPTAMATQMKLYQSIYPQLTKTPLNESATLVLTPREVNDLLILLRNFHALAGVEYSQELKPDAYDIEYEGKKFHLHYTYKYGKHNFNIYAEVIPGYKNNDLLIAPTAFKVGKLRLPQNILASNTSQAIKKLKDNPGYQIFEALVESITILPNGNIEIVYHPAKLKELIPPEVLNSKSAASAAKPAPAIEPAPAAK